jgi:hypothetical protein
MEGDRMFKIKCVIVSVFAVVLLGAILLSCSSNNTGVTPIQNSGKYYGYIYNQNGSPAQGARVSIVSVDYVPSQGLEKRGAIDTSIVTDQNGRFTIDTISAGTYNLFGEGNGVASYAASVTINEAAKASIIAVDTLKVPGSIKGVIQLAPQGDSRRVFIMVIGSYLSTTPIDSDGNFTVKNLAPGKYRFRFLVMDPQFPVLDTVFTVVSGKTTDVGTIVLSTSPGENVQQLEIANNEITGWGIDTTGLGAGYLSQNPFAVSAANLHNVIDGGDMQYLSEGVIEAVFEYLQKYNSQKQATIFFMDFGTNARAAAMVQDWASHITADPIIIAKPPSYTGEDGWDTIPARIPGYDSTVAAVESTLGGITVFAHFSKFYIELSFTGYQDQSQAISDAKLFLDNIKSKVQ